MVGERFHAGEARELRVREGAYFALYMAQQRLEEEDRLEAETPIEVAHRPLAGDAPVAATSDPAPHLHRPS